MKRKINKNEFISTVAKKNRIPVADVRLVYEAIIAEIKTTVCAGKELSLTGFGTFSLKKHKGHPVQFEAKTDTVKDYLILRFAPSDSMMTRIRESGNAVAYEKDGE